MPQQKIKVKKNVRETVETLFDDQFRKSYNREIALSFAVISSLGVAAYFVLPYLSIPLSTAAGVTPHMLRQAAQSPNALKGMIDYTQFDYEMIKNVGRLMGARIQPTAEWYQFLSQDSIPFLQQLGQGLGIFSGGMGAVLWPDGQNNNKDDVKFAAHFDLLDMLDETPQAVVDKNYQPIAMFDSDYMPVVETGKEMELQKLLMGPYEYADMSIKLSR